ncbi:cation diffusion facilitator family transporter [Dictyoglomus sp.]|jgi:cation diffusion facilitator family transporter|uniref:cation diffusion facilitator family transporter n=1 Tax=Dictyoglomus sp. TaxID=28205 RepID=UPI000CCE73C6|nr:MAG: cation transporter [Dictyoglomus turgidum]
MNFSEWLSNKILTKKEYSKKYAGYLEGWVSIVGNLTLFLFKYFAGLSLGSISLIADAFHSLSDVFTSVVVILGFKLGSKPADKEHPYGHGRIEQIATLIIALLLLIVAYDLVRSSFERLMNPHKVEFNLGVFVLLIISAIFKEWMARFSIYLGKRFDASPLIADAWHHRSDAIATLLVTIGLLGSKLGFYRLDGILGVLVSLLIAWVGVDLLKSATSFLIGEAPSGDLVKKIDDIIVNTPGVLNYHDLSVHDYQNEKYITLHIEVDNNLTVKEAHDLALKVQDEIKSKIENSQVTVHIDPKGERED